MKELRVGLVLYGGVSLAIYMNGISTELWNLLRASRARVDGTRDDLDDTANLYAELLDELRYLTGDDLRVVVDVIAGTSAGGVNGSVLAKAIVEGGDASILRDVWLEEADISKLRAEPSARPGWCLRALFCFVECVVGPVRSLKARVNGIPGVSWVWFRDHLYSMIAKPDGHSTPLDGDYFTRMIAGTFRDMDCGDALLPKRASFDLFLTRTDLQGWPRHLPVSQEFHEAPLYERTHAHVMHFRRKPTGGRLHDDFGLTYATRSTASFPVAFAPINYDTVKAAFTTARPNGCIPSNDQFTRDHLPEHGLFDFPTSGAWMVDGGVLDNKPFSHVTRAIEHKPAEHEVYRVVAYVEPDPEAMPEPSNDSAIPKPLKVAANLYKLFRHEPIYEDLRNLRERNDKVADIRRHLDANRAGALRAAIQAGKRRGLSWPAMPKDARTWRRAANEYAAETSLSGYPGYVVLKARSATNVLANAICGALGYPRASRHAYFIRRLVSSWIERQGAFKPPEYKRAIEGTDTPRSQDQQTPECYHLFRTQLSLLRAFDLPFRLRRLQALVRATNELYDAATVPSSGRVVDRAALDAFKSTLEQAASVFDLLQEDDAAIRRVIVGSSGIEEIRTAVDKMIAENDFNPDAVTATHSEHIHAAYNGLSVHFREVNTEQDLRITQALRRLPSDPGNDSYAPIMEAYVTFPFVDLIAFPLLAAADINELVDIKVIRISPQDVPRAGNPPLKSLGLGAFRGFLVRDAREHDMEWGRRDGADRLVALIVTAAGAERLDRDGARDIACTYRERLAQAIEDGSIK